MPPVPPEFETPATRHIPAQIRREVMRRDRERCTYLYEQSGLRCGSQFAIEIDHVIPYAHCGTHEPANLRLLCRAHHSLRTARVRDSASKG